MKRVKKVVYLIMALIVMITIGTVVGVYSIITNNTVEKATLKNVSELADHDRKTITMFVEYNWKNLQRIGERLKRTSNNLKNINQINEYLSYESYESTFDKVYLLMTDGSYYTDITFREDENTVDYYPYGNLFTGESDRVVGFDSLPIMESREVVIYGYELSGVLSGIKIGEQQREVRAIIGVSKRSSIIDGLVIESYVDREGNVRGYSSVVNLDGKYIVDRDDLANFQLDNWFDVIESSDQSDLTKEQVEAKMNNGETFYFYQESGGVRELNYCTPLGSNIGWYFLMSVNDTALVEQTSSLVRMIVVAMSIAVTIIITAMIVVLVMQRKREQAYAQKKAQSEFLSNMSHEIRTPLNGLVGLNYLMMTSIDDPHKHKQVKEWLAKSQSTAKYLLALINDILDISKLRAGKVEITKEPLLIEAIIDSIYSMQCDNIKRRGIEYITDINITAPCIISDEVHIKQVLMNIISNAAKFTPAGGYIKLSVHQTMIDESHVSTAFVCEDTGCGMSKEFLSKIFDEFTQDRNSISASTKGTGLGMPISKLLVEAMGGEITVASEQGKGSKFMVTIPAEVSDLPDYLKFNLDEETEQIANEYSHHFKALKILVAEDNELNAEILIEILNDSGFKTDLAIDGEEAVHKFECSEVGEYDVILMDMRMPKMDGCEAASKIRQMDRADAKIIPIFACTANTFNEDRINAFESGMNDFLTKPVDVKMLLQKLENINNDNHSRG